MCGIVCTVCFGFSLALDGALRVVLVALGGLPIVVACASYIYLMLRRPDDLKSEEFQLRKLALELIQEKGGKVKIESVSINEITNPDLPQLPEPDSEVDR